MSRWRIEPPAIGNFKMMLAGLAKVFDGTMDEVADYVHDHPCDELPNAALHKMLDSMEMSFNAWLTEQRQKCPKKESG